MARLAIKGRAAPRAGGVAPGAAHKPGQPARMSRDTCLRFAASPFFLGLERCGTQKRRSNPLDSIASEAADMWDLAAAGMASVELWHSRAAPYGRVPFPISAAFVRMV